MSDQTAVHNTFVLERSYPKPPEDVFAAFADPDKKRRWYADSRGLEVVAFDQDFRVGGVERLQYRFNQGSPFPGAALVNEGRYQDIVPNRRIVTASTMDLADRRISATLVTFEFLPTDKGTDLICTHQGTFFEGADGPEMRQQGWQTLFDRLEKTLS
ncbi:MAG TPA: SRPBCC family protein [Verrucomicrobiae bacterium]|jgi:uncharacterized protein YndB with AHSA1/START domain|nr:SRPBCC family protein [Verrucomicrobiae bacterium]